MPECEDLLLGAFCIALTVIAMLNVLILDLESLLTSLIRLVGKVGSAQESDRARN